MKTTAGDVVIGNTGPITTIEGEIDDGDAAGKIQNVQGVELPSTGGMGTRVLYTVGGIMIVAGGIYLVSKRRLSAME